MTILSTFIYHHYHPSPSHHQNDLGRVNTFKKRSKSNEDREAGMPSQGREHLTEVLKDK